MVIRTNPPPGPYTMTNLDLLPFAQALRDAHPLWEGYTYKEKTLEAARALRERFDGRVAPKYVLKRLSDMVDKGWEPLEVHPAEPNLMERFHLATGLLNADLGKLFGVHFSTAAHWRANRRRFAPTEAQKATMVVLMKNQRAQLDALIEELDKT